MRIRVEGSLAKGVVAKDIILYIFAQITAGGRHGVISWNSQGTAIRALSMEARMTVCNMSIEMGARGGMIAPDETTFAYIKGRPFAPQGAEWDRKLAEWKPLYSDSDAIFDKELVIDASGPSPP